LGLSFFALSSNYITGLLDQYMFLAKQIGISYSDFLKMPIYQRNYIYEKLIKLMSQ